jgi:hypothetical protein
MVINMNYLCDRDTSWLLNNFQSKGRFCWPWILQLGNIHLPAHT